MHLFALDKTGKRIAAQFARKKSDYICFECRGIVRPRKGAHKKSHFFHLKSSHCRQGQKSIEHIQTQSFLQSQIGESNCELEKPFSEIGRIADLVWETEKLVFEVQCSGISREEVESRNRDYRKLGFEVIWILHDKTFNRLRMTEAEKFLQNEPHYYTNINAFGQGFIYNKKRTVNKMISKNGLHFLRSILSMLMRFYLILFRSFIEKACKKV